jgi:heme/copper-type cytochrome/quinol oxidase subunit 3
MALASNPAASTDGSTSQIEAYLLDVYQQAAETARPSGRRRFISLGSFLGFAGLMTAALAILFAVADGSSGSSIAGAALLLGIIGIAVSVTFYAVEARRWESVGRLPTMIDSSDAASSFYLAAVGFFGFTVAISGALLLLR